MPSAGASNPAVAAERNETFDAGPTIRPEVRAKTQAESLQNRRVDYPALPQTPAPTADRRAPLNVGETRPKSVLPADVRPPAVRTPQLNTLSHRVSGLDPKDRLTSPPLVSKYQDSLRAAASLRPGRSPVIEKPGWFARLNRFFFNGIAPRPPPLRWSR